MEFGDYQKRIRETDQRPVNVRQPVEPKPGDNCREPREGGG